MTSWHYPRSVWPHDWLSSFPFDNQYTAYLYFLWVSPTQQDIGCIQVCDFESVWPWIKVNFNHNIKKILWSIRKSGLCWQVLEGGNWAHNLANYSEVCTQYSVLIQFVACIFPNLQNCSCSNGGKLIRINNAGWMSRWRQGGGSYINNTLNCYLECDFLIAQGQSMQNGTTALGH